MSATQPATDTSTDKLDGVAAHRFATAALKGHRPAATARRWVDEWFADRYGWPLPLVQARRRDDFMSLIQDAIIEQRASR